MNAIPEYINKGELDLLLIKPVNLQFIVSTRQIGLGEFAVRRCRAVSIMVWFSCQRRFMANVGSRPSRVIGGRNYFVLALADDGNFVVLDQPAL